MRRTMDLRRLLDDRAAPALEVSGLASDSRRVRRGDLYVARRGNAFDGHDFVADAVAAGAVAVVSQRRVDAPVPNIVAPGIVQNLGALGARFYDSPGEAVEIVAVTGTNGKTTVAYNLARIRGNRRDGGLRRDLGVGHAARTGTCDADDGRSATPAGAAETAGRSRRLPRRPRSEFARVGPRSSRPGRCRRRGFHEPKQRPPRLPRHDGTLRGGQAQALRTSASHGDRQRR